ncbi:TadE/TadG family type IV pilus assembly protein [Pseudorhodoplanes sp.]|uniref:TadE/TadG family type IV pilus assembly protein n=1 Tax=Pseudorhodoplanes sp. TaxID=1934341 RepID=UPI002C4775AB|nr:TadE/TadG family type IV pilus assembly protein [Pseudorhodoplanes sp.]HWV41998.1 TadE/TadG family type IV pilus assembly protein [Pseudorhodoplanes sp.]
MCDTSKVNLAARALRAITPRVIRRFARKNDGAAAVEFAMVAAPFLALVFAILETALVFFAGQVLETAAADSARLILTGQAQKGGLDPTQFKDEVCKRVFGLFDCANGITVDVRTYSSFGSADTSKPIDSSGKLTFTPSFAPGKAGDIVVVRLLYQWPVYVSLLGLNLADLNGGKRLLMATAAFKNEPFE